MISLPFDTPFFRKLFLLRSLFYRHHIKSQPPCQGSHKKAPGSSCQALFRNVKEQSRLWIVYILVNSSGCCSENVLYFLLMVAGMQDRYALDKLASIEVSHTNYQPAHAEGHRNERIQL